ncbi:hypothetical protein OHS18_41820 [Amycolatopsis sp. NBC_00355]|uniref:hypothetical protein n=1 Tax=Amycolatopsis sp. NBC_00355 TaxID=2975957 RepID=UPI002E25AEA1
MSSTPAPARSPWPLGNTVACSKHKQAHGWGNAVPPAMAEVLGSALIETFTGKRLEPTA